MLLDTPVCDFDWQAPDFSLADAHGTRYSLADLKGENGLLIAFICNHCPYVKAIIDRLVADAAILKQDGIETVAIMPNDYLAYPDDAPGKMIEFAAAHQMNFPYLLDEDQAVALAYGAVCTPDFYGFNNEGGLQYRGRLDDAPRGAAQSRNAELVSAMQVIARTGRGPELQTPSMGCSIKWK